MAESTISLSDLLDFFLLLQSVRRLEVALLDVDELVSQNFSNGLLRPEGVLADSLGDQVDSLVDSSEGRHVHCLLSNHTSSTNSGGVFSGRTVSNCFEENLYWIFSSLQMDDLKGLLNNVESLEFLS